jgi:hypothetical protein
MAKVEGAASSADGWLKIANQVPKGSKDWAGALDESGKAKQVLIVKNGDKFGAVQSDGSIQALDGAADMDSAKAMARTAIKGGKFPSAINFPAEIAQAMEAAAQGGGAKPADDAPAATGADGKPATKAAPDPVAVQAEIAKFFADNPKNIKEITLPDGTKSKIYIGNKTAMDQSGKQLPLKSTMSPEQISAEDQAAMDAAIKQGFGVIPAQVSGTVNQPNVNTAGIQQGAPSPEAPADAPPVVTPASMPGRAANGAANYTETEAGAPTETTLPAEGGTPPAATPVTGQPATTGA